MAAATKRFGEEKLCISAKKREVGRERRVARVAPGGAGEGGEGLLMSHSVWRWGGVTETSGLLCFRICEAEEREKKLPPSLCFTQQGNLVLPTVAE